MSDHPTDFTVDQIIHATYHGEEETSIVVDGVVVEMAEEPPNQSELAEAVSMQSALIATKEQIPNQNELQFLEDQIGKLDHNGARQVVEKFQRAMKGKQRTWFSERMCNTILIIWLKIILLFVIIFIGILAMVQHMTVIILLLGFCSSGFQIVELVITLYRRGSRKVRDRRRGVIRSTTSTYTRFLTFKFIWITVIVETGVNFLCAGYIILTKLFFCQRSVSCKKHPIRQWILLVGIGFLAFLNLFLLHLFSDIKELKFLKHKRLQSDKRAKEK